MGEGQTNNPNETPSGHTMKFWGLLAMVAPATHTTQQKFLIGSFPEIYFFIGEDDIIDISVPIQSLPMRFSQCMALIHIYTHHASHNVVEESSSIQYST